ncbi:hypothetical protein Taro_047393, partial [Colocasia esculenta]|nr:hypothetical protein [Colocasia esculenta]
PFLPLSLFPSSQAVEGSLRRSGAVERPGARAERRRVRGARRRRPTDARAPLWGGFSVLRAALCVFLVAVALPFALRCIAWLPCVLVRFPRTVCYCPGEGFSQDCSALISTVAMLPQGLRCATSIGLASAFWRVFPERCLGGSGGGCPRTGLCCFCSSTCCSVLYDGPCSSVIWGLCILVEVLPRIALCRSWQRFFPGVLCVCFGPPLCCPC